VARNDQPFTDAARVAPWSESVSRSRFSLLRIPPNLVVFSIKTKGLRNFARRVWTIFARFGFSERRGANGLHAIVDALEPYDVGPTFYVPAVVLERHPQLMAAVAARGAEMGLHGDVHVDYRLLDRTGQYEHTERAIATFERMGIPWQGFRNPYLGWTEGSVVDFAELGITYDSNEAIDHDVGGLGIIQPRLAAGYELSLSLFQALPCTAYGLRPRLESGLVRIPISVPDDEMLFDRLRLDAPTVGRVWSDVMRRVYEVGGVYALNIHPERGVLCREALENLLGYATALPEPVWLARLDAIAAWWRERANSGLEVTARRQGIWDVQANAPDDAVLVVRDDSGVRVVLARKVTVTANLCPVIALSPQTPPVVAAFLREQGYPVMPASEDERDQFALYLDMPEGLSSDRRERWSQCSALVDRIEGLDSPLVKLGLWPNGSRAALAISSDVDSITVQDFFLRILEWRDTHGARYGQAHSS